MKINSIYSVHFLHMFFIYGKYVWNIYLIKEHHFFVAIFGTMITSISIQYTDNIHVHMKNDTSFRETKRFDKIKFPKKTNLFRSYL